MAVGALLVGVDVALVALVLGLRLEVRVVEAVGLVAQEVDVLFLVLVRAVVEARGGRMPRHELHVLGLEVLELEDAAASFL